MKKKYIKKIFAASIISLLFVQVIYITMVEPTVAAAVETDSDTVVVTLNVLSGISITDAGAVTMAPNLGIEANSSVGGSAWTVKTNNITGYTLGVKADASPALRITAAPTNFFTDYTDTGNVPEQWSLATGAKEFGFTAYGPNVTDGTWGTGDLCETSSGSGVPLTTMKYVGFETTDQTIATSNTVTTTTGTVTNICFAAEQKDVFAASGTYNTTITATATTN